MHSRYLAAVVTEERPKRWTVSAYRRSDPLDWTQRCRWSAECCSRWHPESGDCDAGGNSGSGCGDAVGGSPHSPDC